MHKVFIKLYQQFLSLKSSSWESKIPEDLRNIFQIHSDVFDLAIAMPNHIGSDFEVYLQYQILSITNRAEFSIFYKAYNSANPLNQIKFAEEPLVILWCIYAAQGELSKENLIALSRLSGPEIYKQIFNNTSYLEKVMNHSAFNIQHIQSIHSRSPIKFFHNPGIKPVAENRRSEADNEITALTMAMIVQP